MSDDKNFCKNCPKCNAEICYSRKDNLKDSIERNSVCRSCSKKGKPLAYLVDGKIPPNILEKMSKSWFKNGDRPKNADTRKGKTLEEIYGEERGKEIIENYKNVIKFKESNNKRTETMRVRWEEGVFDNVKRKCSEETKEIHRINFINRLISTTKNFHPSYNKKACEYFNKLMIITNTNIKHALNGGELHIKELGYWVDGYDEENNIVYEFDEKRHFTKNDVLTEKDILRQNKIINLLKCEFIRIKESDIG